ncbi:MAG: fatty-acid synthase, partial [Chloroflexi bacterium]|nr:fatty-acid synthase [Chloroflexota bacterium]
MPARDVFHDAVRNALIKDGWVITHDPYTFAYGVRNLFVDLGAEWPVAAEKNGKKIAVEIKGFGGTSEVRDLEVAVGQFLLYREMIAEQEP